MSFNPRKSKSTRYQRKVEKQLFMPSKGVSCSSNKRVFTTRNDAWKSLIARQKTRPGNTPTATDEEAASLEVYKCASCGFWHHTAKRQQQTAQ